MMCLLLETPGRTATASSQQPALPHWREGTVLETGDWSSTPLLGTYHLLITAHNNKYVATEI